MNTQAVAVFDWRVYSPGTNAWCLGNFAQSVGSVRLPGHEYSSAIHVDLNVLALIGMRRIDQLVGVEIDHAMRSGQIGDELGKDLWQAWCEMGGERVAFDLGDEE